MSEKSSDSDDDKQCAICLDDLKDPIVVLPCGHKYCTGCLGKWRSKFDATLSNKSCPQCRKKIPPTRQMYAQYKAQKILLPSLLEKTQRSFYELPPIPGEPDYEPHTFSEVPLELKIQLRSLSHEEQQDLLRAIYQKNYETCVEEFQIMEDQYGENWDDILEDEAEATIEELPMDITQAAADNRAKIVLQWLGKPPIAPERINAKNPNKFDRTLLAEAVYEGHTCLMSVLLQYGADVDPINAFGTTPFRQAVSLGLDPSTRLLLEWGASKDLGPDEPTPQQYAKMAKNKTLAALLESPLGGRRCEILGLNGRKDLNGTTCVAMKYLKAEDRYASKVEHTEEMISIKPSNLKRRDRTPIDCGTWTVFEGENRHGRNKWSVNRFESRKGRDGVGMQF